MKGGQNLAYLQQEKKEKDEKQWVPSQPCIICGKSMSGAYANHGDAGWTCSSVCMREQDAKPKYPGHTAEAFEKLHNL